MSENTSRCIWLMLGQERNCDGLAKDGKYCDYYVNKQNYSHAKAVVKEQYQNMDHAIKKVVTMKD